MADWLVVSTAVTFGKYAQEPVDRLHAAGCEVRLNPYGRPLTASEMVEFAGEADALILGNDSLPARVIKRLKNMKVIARYGTGFDGVDLKEAEKRRITITFTPATNREETADFTWGLILDLARHITHMVNITKAGEWKKDPGISLYGKTIGIIGVGQVGTAVARRAMGFGMDILGYDILERTEPTVYGLIYTTLNELLRRSDIVTLHVPLTAITRHMINAREFRIMKGSALLVNTARSLIVNEKALGRALEEGQIAGYAVDVFDEEPPVHSPLFDLDNYIITPHVAGHTLQSSLRMGDVAVDNILAVKDGVTPPDIVTPYHLVEHILGRA